jgi:hypothetical protein
LVGDGIYIELLSDPGHGGFAEAALAIGEDNDHGWQVSSVLFAILVELSVGGFRFWGMRSSAVVGNKRADNGVHVRET